jgi:hypothetical protein
MLWKKKDDNKSGAGQGWRNRLSVCGAHLKCPHHHQPPSLSRKTQAKKASSSDSSLSLISAAAGLAQKLAPPIYIPYVYSFYFYKRKGKETKKI